MLFRSINIKEKGNQISQRLTLPSLKDIEVESFYYSSWIVSAIHVLISIDNYQTPSAIAQRLSIHEELVRGVLNRLKSFGLVTEKNGEWQVGHSHLHLSKNSPFQPMHQANWKLLAIQNTQLKSSGIHYCNVHSISQSDFRIVQEKMLKFISELLETIKASPAEKLATINLDYFEP